MRLLLDSHIVMWWFAGSRRLPKLIRTAIESAEDVWVSAACAYELGFKARAGKIELAPKFFEALPSAMAESGFSWLAITYEHALTAALLPLHHRDPFDRILAAQASLDALKLATVDRIFRRYGIDTLG